MDFPKLMAMLNSLRGTESITQDGRDSVNIQQEGETPLTPEGLVPPPSCAQLLMTADSPVRYLAPVSQVNDGTLSTMLKSAAPQMTPKYTPYLETIKRKRRGICSSNTAPAPLPTASDEVKEKSPALPPPRKKMKTLTTLNDPSSTETTMEQQGSSKYVGKKSCLREGGVPFQNFEQEDEDGNRGKSDEPDEKRRRESRQKKQEQRKIYVGAANRTEWLRLKNDFGYESHVAFTTFVIESMRKLHTKFWTDGRIQDVINMDGQGLYPPEVQIPDIQQSNDMELARIVSKNLPPQTQLSQNGDGGTEEVILWEIMP